MEQYRSEVIFISVSKASLSLTPSDTAWKVSVSIHQRNMNTLATEIYKAKKKSLLRLLIRCLSLLIKTTILEMCQFLKGRDISQSIMEVKVFHP